ncbi:hypothetical protein COCOBI_04-8120 [Coccomyxa sp. Obi]|nr:hypothetical protein COCOBI_04-8120 [Coccomyxa sp. Obi]
MTTRGSLARGQGQQQFQGNVQKWVRQWVEPGTGPGSSKVALLKWVPTGDRSGSKPGPRFPHLQPVSNANLKVPVGNKDTGKKPIPRQHELLSQPAVMDIDGDQQVLVGELQREETQSAAVEASRARETNGEAHAAPEHRVNQGATELPGQETPAASSQHAGARENEAALEVGRSVPDVAAEPTQASNSHAVTVPQRTSASAVDLASQQPAPASQSDPEAQQQQPPQQDNVHGSTQELQDSTVESGRNADEKLPMSASVGDDAPGQTPAGGDDDALTGRQAQGQTPAGRDDEALTGLGPPDQAPNDAALTGQEAPDQAVAAERNGTLVGDQVPSGRADEAPTGPGLPFGAADQAPASTASETAASAAAVEAAEQLQQQLAEGAPLGPRSTNQQSQIHSEPAVAAPTLAKRPAEEVGECMESDAKRAKAEHCIDLGGLPQ